MLPAREGDAVLLEYGDPAAPHRVLVDVGPGKAYQAVRARLERIPDRRLDLLVLTHVDRDHVEGAVPLLNDRGLGLAFGDVWFNGYRHLTDDLAGPHGEMVGALLVERRLPWNAAFARRAVRRDATAALPARELPGGMRLTVLAPTRQVLLRLVSKWEEECRRAGIVPGDTADALAALDGRPALRPEDHYLGAAVDVAALAAAESGTDTSPSNAASLVLLVEYAGRSLLLAGDAPADQVVAGLDQLAQERGSARLRLDLFKLPHHGSARNVTVELVRRAPAKRYLFSSDGSGHGHPDPEAVARVVLHAPRGAELVFNYRTEQTRRWEDADLQQTHGYAVTLPDEGDAPGVLSAL